MSEPAAPVQGADEAWYGIRRRFLRGFILGTVGYVVVVVFVLGTMWVLVDRLSTAKSEYEGVQAQLTAAHDQLKKLHAESDTLQKNSAELKQRYDDVLQRKQTADKALADSQAQIAALKDQLNQIYDFKPHIVPVDEIDEKMAYGVLGERGFQLFRLALKGAHDKLSFGSANNPAGGFTSPGYAQYVLGQMGITTPVSSLKPRVGPPKNGDIITYQPAYYMFYFRIPDTKKEFVIGMTPEGVLALEPNFGTRIGVFTALQP
jgi:regulator of replication initiation timing